MDNGDLEWMIGRMDDGVRMDNVDLEWMMGIWNGWGFRIDDGDLE